MAGTLRTKRRKRGANSGRQVATTGRPKGLANPKRAKPDSRLSERQRSAHKRALHQIVSSMSVGEEECRSRWYEIGRRVLSKSRVMKDPNFTLTNQQDLELMAELFDGEGAVNRLAAGHGYGVVVEQLKRDIDARSDGGSNA